jgi:hemolysin D
MYKALVSLKQNIMQVEGKQVKLVPGMSASVEIKTGKRRLIEFFLALLLKYKDESIRER